MDSGSRQRRALVLADVERLHIPRRYWESSWAKVRPVGSEHHVLVGRFIGNVVASIRNGWGLHLWGPNDSGKTALACLVLMEARRWGFSGLFVRSPKLRQVDINNERFDDSHTWLQRAEGVDVLVIDDLGKEYRKENGSYAERMIEGLIRERQGAKRSTIVTTNLTGGKGLSDLYQESMLRVMQASIYPIRVEGHNYRLEEAQELSAAMAQG